MGAELLLSVDDLDVRTVVVVAAVSSLLGVACADRMLGGKCPSVGVIGRTFTDDRGDRPAPRWLGL